MILFAVAINIIGLEILIDLATIQSTILSKIQKIKDDNLDWARISGYMQVIDTLINSECYAYLN